MVVIFFADRVILGKSDFRTVPRVGTTVVPAAIEADVAKYLLDMGFDWLVPISLGGTAEENT